MLMANPFDQAIFDLFEEHAEELDNYGAGQLPTRIEHEARPGFVPWTDGGWHCRIKDNLQRVFSDGSLYAAGPQASLQQAIDYSLDLALETFIHEHGAALRRLYDTTDADLIDLVSYHDLYEKGRGELAEALWEQETDTLQSGGEFWLEFRAQYYAADTFHNESGEDEIYFAAGINLDYGYGRDKGLAKTFQRVVKVSDLTEEKLAGIVQEMHDSLLAK